jgi:hypothetical protein
MGASIFGSFVLFSWVTAQTQKWGFLDKDHLSRFNDLHFWLNYALFAILGIDYVCGFARELYRAYRGGK